MALVDRARFPRDKLCGGGITGRSQRYMAEIFGQPAGAHLGLTSRRVRLVSGRTVLADLDDAPPILLTLRQDLDADLFGRALEQGAQDFSGRRIAALEPDAARVTLTDGTELAGRVLIGADGVNSATARVLFGRVFDPARIGFALEAEAPVPHPPATDPVVEIDMSAAAWGYGWAFPKAGSLTIGVGGVQGRNPDMRQVMAAYLLRHGLPAEGLKVKGHFLPAGDPRPSPGRGRALLAGDAAGLIDPMTGEGIAWALKSGQLAGQAAAQAIAAGGADQAHRHYSCLLRPVQAEMRYARRLRGLVYHPALRGSFLRHLAGQPATQRRFLALLSGDLDYADLGLLSVPKHLLGMALRALRR